jgi:hypothetical protein
MSPKLQIIVLSVFSLGDNVGAFFLWKKQFEILNVRCLNVWNQDV